MQRHTGAKVQFAKEDTLTEITLHWCKVILAQVTLAYCKVQWWEVTLEKGDVCWHWTLVSEQGGLGFWWHWWQVKLMHGATAVARRHYRQRTLVQCATPPRWHCWQVRITGARRPMRMVTLMQDDTWKVTLVQGDTIATCNLGARLHLYKTKLVTGDYMYLFIGGKTLQNVPNFLFLSRNFFEATYTLQRQFRLYIPFLGNARPQPPFPHSCVCERFIYSLDRSTYFLQQER